jgi:hypothetical protein
MSSSYLILVKPLTYLILTHEVISCYNWSSLGIFLIRRSSWAKIEVDRVAIKSNCFNLTVDSSHLN